LAIASIVLVVAPSSASAAIKVSVGTPDPLAEPSSSPADMTFPVTLSKKAKKRVTVKYATKDLPSAPGPNAAAEGEDYDFASGTAKIGKGKKETDFNIKILEDHIVELDESFRVVITKPKNAKLGDDEATGTIEDSDVDSDGDGISDEVDQCPLDPNPGGAFCPATLYDINNGSVPANRGIIAAGVAITSVGGDKARVAHQPTDPVWEGVANSAIELDLSGLTPIPPISVGSVVDVSGIVTSADLLTVTSLTVTGSITPTTHSVAISDLFPPGGPTANLNDVLVSVGPASIQSHQVDGDWNMAQGFVVDQQIASLPAYADGTVFSSITAIADTSGTTGAVSPRSAADLTVGAPVLVTFTVPNCIDTTQDATGVVGLSTPATVDTAISLSSSDEAKATVPAQVTVSTGASTASVPINTIATGNVEITATLDGNQIVRSFEIKGEGENSCNPPNLVINEVDYDQVGTDGTSYIEIYNPTGSAKSLSTLAVVLVNGSNNLEYRRFALSGAGTSLAAGGYLVIRNAAVGVPVGTATIDGTGDFIQNGPPDGIALIDASTSTVLDALSYEGSITAAQITDFPQTVNLLESGTATTAADFGSGDGALARIPNGGDTNNPAADWALTASLTPGSANPASP
jgi:hypothetical protein